MLARDRRRPSERLKSMPQPCHAVSTRSARPSVVSVDGRRRRGGGWPRAVLLWLGLAMMGDGAAAAPPGTPVDAYIAGYAAAVLEREFNSAAGSMAVRDGVITLPAQDLKGADPATVSQALSRIRGVVRVEVLQGDRAVAAAAPPDPTAKADVSAQPPVDRGGLPTGALPRGQLFKPLLADPRWPHFSAAYHYYTDNFKLRNVDAKNIATVSFGEMFSLYRDDLPYGQWEAGVQAGVFSDFGLDTDSNDLLNADYFVALLGGYRYEGFSALGRIFHQSSHLGDELLLATQLNRVNLSYEGVDLKLSYEFPVGLRFYGGGGGLFHVQPSEFKPWSVQYGMEYKGRLHTEFASIRPVFAIDFKNYEVNDWATDVSARGGIQFDSVQALGRNLQFLVEYFNGHSPSGQFYRRQIEYVGLGFHFHF
jgi:hypothetical protein